MSLQVVAKDYAHCKSMSNCHAAAGLINRESFSVGQSTISHVASAIPLKLHGWQ